MNECRREEKNMSEFVQVGVSAMRDPVTGKMLDGVPLYVERRDLEKVPEVDMKQMTRDLVKRMDAERAEGNGNDTVSDI